MQEKQISNGEEIQLIAKGAEGADQFAIGVSGAGELIFDKNAHSKWKYSYENKELLPQNNQIKYALRIVQLDLPKAQDLLTEVEDLKLKLGEAQKECKKLRLQLKEAKQKAQVQEQNLSNTKQEEHKNVVEIPQPVPYAPIRFTEEGQEISYTDCWEISVLRFLHFVYGHKGKINLDKLKILMDQNNQHCKSLIKYFENNNAYSMKRKDYETPQGFKIRADWCQFVNNSKLVKCKIKGKYEVAATVPNLVSFFKGFFPKLKVSVEQLEKLTIESAQSGELFKSYDKVLNKIYSELSFDYKISTKIQPTYIEEEDFFYINATQNIYIDGKHMLDWEIYESFDTSNSQEMRRLGGHSDLRFFKKQQ